MRNLLTELSKELNAGGTIDPDTRELLRRLNEDLDAKSGDDHTTALDRAKRLESRFAASHPVAARIAGELVDTIAKMGI